MERTAHLDGGLQRQEAEFRAYHYFLKPSPSVVLPLPSSNSPSKENESFWLIQHDLTNAVPRPNPATSAKPVLPNVSSSYDCGKWLLFTPVDYVDTDWVIIKEATRRGMLGHSSKVATMRPNPHARSPDTKVICVYTTDCDADRSRVLLALRELGWRLTLRWKSDAATYAGLYAHRSHTNICESTSRGGSSPWWRGGPDAHPPSRLLSLVAADEVMPAEGISPSGRPSNDSAGAACTDEPPLFGAPLPG
eukprot:TRINITY_DN58778_c0_g1_i1.p1 TRINITY_DN58778_c0_g1~~TRINITY_DN58778_c0_g1_i1.p1  ORF type:complete len:249 (+),score=3.83 TRINITY_DN58778_c0_g1_i1:110-856(+)